MVDELTVTGRIPATTVAEAAAGDADALARIVGAHHDDMARICYVICGDRDMAQDAVQAAWPIAWRKLDSLLTQTDCGHGSWRWPRMRSARSFGVSGGTRSSRSRSPTLDRPFNPPRSRDVAGAWRVPYVPHEFVPEAHRSDVSKASPILALAPT